MQTGVAVMLNLLAEKSAAYSPALACLLAQHLVHVGIQSIRKNNRFLNKEENRKEKTEKKRAKTERKKDKKRR
jgi:threonine/homoserine/homoserine lactone efflux protein